jgi:hypothetical protein
MKEKGIPESGYIARELDEETAHLILTDHAFRIEYFRHDFEAFFDYHFGWQHKAPFEPDWNLALE